VIGDVDCTHDDSKDLCTKYGVRGFPTFKYFTDATDIFGHKYEGDRTFEGFKDIVETKLGPGCGINFMDRCSEEQKESIEIYKNMDSKHRNDKVKELAKLIKEKEDEWKTETDALQKEYDDMGNQRNQMKVYELQSKYQRLTMEKDALVSLHKPRLRLLQGVVRDTSAHAGLHPERHPAQGGSMGYIHPRHICSGLGTDSCGTTRPPPRRGLWSEHWLFQHARGVTRI